MRLIKLFSASAVIFVFAGGPITGAHADWTTRSLDSSYYSGAGSYKTPPPGGWEEVLEREIQQEQAKREIQEVQASSDASQQQPAAAAAKADNCENPQSQPDYSMPAYVQPAVYSRTSQIQPNRIQRRQGQGRSNGSGKRRHERGGRGFDLPWGGDRGGSGFDLPWGGDRGGAGFGMPWDSDRGWPGFGGQRNHGDRGRRNDSRSSWFW